MRGNRTVPEVFRQIVERLGLKPYARRLFMWALDDERRLSIDGCEMRFKQSDFGDYIELNQIVAEQEIIHRLREEINPDDVFLDVGSNIGVYAVAIGSQLRDGTVIAVEAVPSTADKLVKNLQQNGVTGCVENVAFTDTPGQVTVTVPDAHGSSSITSDGEGTRTVRVNSVRGDEYLARKAYPTPNVLKIDVEGHERAVLRGLKETLSDPACRLIYCEIHHSYHSIQSKQTDSVHGILRAEGFTVSHLSDLPGDRYVVRASKE